MAHLPPLLDQQGYEDRAGRAERPLDPTEAAQFAAYTLDASALVRQVAEDNFMDGEDVDSPDGIIPVMFRVVHRAMENPLGHTSETVGNYTWQKGRVVSSGVYLTDEDEADIRSALDPPDTGFAAVPLSNFPLPGVS